MLRPSARASAVGLVVGLPLNLDGSDSPRTQSVRAFARNLLPLDLPVLLWDERWSTVAVERTMIEADQEPRQARREDRRPCRGRYPPGGDRRAGARWLLR